MTLTSAIRRWVWERDAGRCRICGRDLDALQREMEAYATAAGGDVWVCGQYFQVMELGDYWQRLVGGLPLGEIHHSQATAEGGCSRLAELWLVCLRCHKGETRKLAGRRAIRGRRHTFRAVIPAVLEASRSE